MAPETVDPIDWSHPHPANSTSMEANSHLNRLAFALNYITGIKLLLRVELLIVNPNYVAPPKIDVNVINIGALDIHHLRKFAGVLW